MRKAMAIATSLVVFTGCSVLNLSPRPPQPPQREFSRDFWRDRTKQLLKRNFPRHQSLVEGLVVNIELDEDPYAFSEHCATDACAESSNITVSKGYLEGLLRSRWGESGYMAVLDHEMAHLIRNHHSPRTRTPGSRFFDMDTDLYSANEHEADQLAMGFLKQQGRNPCALLGLFSVLDSVKHWSEEDGDLTTINLDRWQVVKKTCAHVGRGEDKP